MNSMKLIHTKPDINCIISSTHGNTKILLLSMDIVDYGCPFKRKVLFS